VNRWIPILSGDVAAQAWQAVDAVAGAIFEGDYAQEQRRHRVEEDAVLFTYLAAARGEPVWARRAAERLNVAIEGASRRRGWLGLYGGLCGMGFTLEHLSPMLEEVLVASSDDADSGDEEDEDLAVEVDDAVLHFLRNEKPGASDEHYDLISGLAGYGVYFLERLPRPTAVEGLTRVIDRLEALAQAGEPGLTWYSGPELLPDWQREKWPDGYYNLGVAHGIPGVMLLLSEAAAAGVDGARARRLLDGAFTWLVAQKKPVGSPAWFGSRVAPGQERDDSRQTWCYGDLGLLTVLLQVARTIGRRDWDRFAHAMLDHCLSFTDPLLDPALCHGTAGAAHMFNRIYQAEGDLRCRDAAVKWFERTLALRQPGADAGGFLVRRTPGGGREEWEASPALLDGAIGVALALIAALTPLQPGWDRLLMLSGRGWEGAAVADPLVRREAQAQASESA
jgi:hypothetical protein